MGMDVLLSVALGGWSTWGEHFVKRQPLARVQQHIGARPSVDQAKGAVLRAIATAGPGGRVIINVGHGSAGDPMFPEEGAFELAPGGVMRIVGRGVNNGFVDVFYDTNPHGPPAMSDMEQDRKFAPQSPRLAHWAVYREISRAFKATRPREVVLLTCRVGGATEFLRKVANDWGVVVRAHRQRVALTEDVTQLGRQVVRRFYMHLENAPPAGKSAADLVVLEEEIPYGPGDTYLVGPPLP